MALPPLDEELLAYVFSDDPAASPYTLFDEMRAATPFHDSALGVKLCAAYGPAYDVLHNPAFGNDIRSWDLYDQLAMVDGSRVFFWRAASRQLLLLDPPDHTRIRKLMSRAFTYRTVANLTPEIERIVAAALDRLPPSGTFDLMTGFAHRVPVDVIGRMLGVPPDERDHFAGLARGLAVHLDPMQMFLSPEVTRRSDRAAWVFAEYVASHIRRRRRHPGDDLVSQLIVVEEAGDRLTEEELGAGTALLLIAGLDTTSNLLGSAVTTLVRQPALLARLHQEPELWPQAIEEVLRLESPIQSTARVAKEDTHVAGRPVRRGEMVLVLNGAANRDPAVFPDPEHFDLARDESHIAFGHGLHHCLGAALARRQAAMALPAFFDRYPHVELAPGMPRWRRSFSFRGPSELRLVAGRARPRPGSHRDGGDGRGSGPHRWLLRGRRSVGVARFTGRTALAAATARVRRAGVDESRQEEIDDDFHRRTARELLALMSEMKGASMKLGQLLAFLDLGLPPVYRQVLSRLQDGATALPTEQVRQVVERQLGRSLTAVFAELSPEPVATASIGQVHRGRLHDGQDVAVKVQYPGIADAIEADFDNLHLVHRLLDLVGRLAGLHLDVPSLLAEARTRLTEEVDYPREADMYASFRRRFADDDDIHVPEAFPSLSGPSVLVTEWADGWGWVAAGRQPQARRDRWGQAIFRFVYQSLYDNRVFNADPHPGNYVFRPDGRVTVLDFGCVQRVGERELAAQRAAAVAIDSGDRTGLLAAFEQLGYAVTGRSYDAERIYAWAEYLYRPALAREGFTYTPEYAREVYRRHLDRDAGWSDVLDRFDYPRHLLFMNRINLGLPSVLGGLRASGRWRDVIERYVFGHASTG